MLTPVSLARYGTTVASCNMFVACCSFVLAYSPCVKAEDAVSGISLMRHVEH